MDNRPIGIFDSGLGGLTALKELRRLMPKEDIVYFGDTGRVPYGARSKETLQRFALQDARFLMQFDVKMIVAACGTISSVITDETLAKIPTPFTGVVSAGATAAVHASNNKKIGVIGTSATIHSGSYEKIIAGLDPAAQVMAKACPLFVPLVENGYIDDNNPVTTLVAEEYLSGFLPFAPDTLILGCTHYPLLKGIIGKILPGVTLIDVGLETARNVKNYLEENNLCAENGGKSEYFVSADTADFEKISERFLGHRLESAPGHMDVDAL